MRKEKAEIDQWGGEHVVQAEARRGYLADPALDQSLAEPIEQQRGQRRRQPGEQRGGRGVCGHGIRSGRGALATPAAPSGVYGRGTSAINRQSGKNGRRSRATLQ